MSLSSGMAQMIPEELPSSSRSKGERGLFQILQRLPDHYVVYYEPLVKKVVPDFVVIAPDLGILVIEVKGWEPAWMVKWDDDDVLIEKRESQKKERHPLRQAREYMFQLKDLLEEHPLAKPLLHPEGPHQGKLRFPLAHCAVMHNVSMRSAEAKGHDFLRCFPTDLVVFEEEFNSWMAGVDGHSICRILKSYFEHTWGAGVLDGKLVDVIRSVIHRGSILREPFGRKPAPGGVLNDQILNILDLKQEAYARQMRSGHRIVSGVAGSGKTAMLIARARHLSARRNYQILVLCYNVCLAHYLRSCLSDCPNVTVLHFHGLASEVGVDFDPEITDDAFGERVLLQLEAGTGFTGRFDAVLIDEGQDYAPDWFRCALVTMRDPVDGDLFIVGDKGQGLSRRNQGVTWASVGIQAQGRTKRLNFNYRNTRQIVEVAEKIACPGDDEDEKRLSSIWIDPDQTVREGPVPVLARKGNREEECQVVLNVVNRLLQGRWFGENLPARLEGYQVGILLPPNLSPEEKDLITRLEQRINEIDGSPGATWITRQRRNQDQIGNDQVKILNLRLVKGLQFRAVIIPFADKLRQLEEEDNRNIPDDADALFYVGMTRSEELLLITCSANSPFLDLIATSQSTRVGGDEGKLEVYRGRQKPL